MSDPKTNARFYVLERTKIGSAEEKVWGTDALQADGFQVSYDTARCNLCGGYLELLRWLRPYNVEVTTWGNEYGDVLFINNNLLVSARFRALYDEYGLTGLKPFEEPVNIVKVRHRRRMSASVPKYYRTGVQHSEAMIDQAASEFHWSDNEPVCFLCRGKSAELMRWKRIIIEPESWKGEDIFVPRGLFVFVTSERFQRFCDSNRITNVELTPADAYGRDYYPGRDTLSTQQS